MVDPSRFCTEHRCIAFSRRNVSMKRLITVETVVEYIE